MKTKLFAIMALILLVFAFPYAFAHEEDDAPDDGHDAPSDNLGDTKTENADNSGSDAAEPVALRTAIVNNKPVAQRVAPKAVAAENKNELLRATDRVAQVRIDAAAKITAAREILSDTQEFTKLKDVQRERLKTLQEAQIERVKELSEEQIDKFANLDRARIKKLSELTPGEIASKLESVRVIKAGDDFKFRPLTVEQAQRSERAIKQLKENEQKLRERYEERKDSLEQLKERLHECRNDSSDECAQVTDEAITHAKEAALAAADRVEAVLGKVKERIAGSQDLTQEQAAEKESKIDKLLGKVAEIKASIDAATTKEALNHAVRQLKEIVSESKEKIKEKEDELIRARVLGIFRSTEIIEKRIDCSINQLPEGTDASSTEAKLDSYTSLMVEARAKADDAKAAFDAGETEQAKALLKEAHDIVMNARDTLAEIRRELIGLGGQICEGEQEIAVTDDSDNGGAE